MQAQRGLNGGPWSQIRHQEADRHAVPQHGLARAAYLKLLKGDRVGGGINRRWQRPRPPARSIRSHSQSRALASTWDPSGTEDGGGYMGYPSEHHYKTAEPRRQPMAPVSTNRARATAPCPRPSLPLRRRMGLESTSPSIPTPSHQADPAHARVLSRITSSKRANCEGGILGGWPGAPQTQMNVGG